MIFAAKEVLDILKVAAISILIGLSLSALAVWGFDIEKSKHPLASSLSMLQTIELVLIAPIVENSIVFLMGAVVRKITIDRRKLFISASVVCLAFIWTHVHSGGWPSIGSSPFGLILALSAFGLFWNKGGIRCAYIRVLLLHMFQNLFVVILHYSLEKLS